MMPDSNQELEVEAGNNGAGEHCDDQLMRYGGGAAVGGKNSVEEALIRNTL